MATIHALPSIATTHALHGHHPRIALYCHRPCPQVRLLYCEMLGHDATFATIHALQFASAQDVLIKKVRCSIPCPAPRPFRWTLAELTRRALACTSRQGLLPPPLLPIPSPLI